MHGPCYVSLDTFSMLRPAVSFQGIFSGILLKELILHCRCPPTYLFTFQTFRVIHRNYQLYSFAVL